MTFHLCGCLVTKINNCHSLPVDSFIQPGIWFYFKITNSLFALNLYKYESLLGDSEVMADFVNSMQW